MTWVWFVLAIVLVGVELMTTELVAVWFAASAVLLGIVTGIAPSLGIVWQVVIFVVFSALLVVATRPFVKRFTARKKGTETNLELVVGHKALVVTKIENEYEQGEVKINGLVWSARTLDGDVIEVGTSVIVREIQGNKAIVEKIDNAENK